MAHVVCANIFKIGAISIFSLPLSCELFITSPIYRTRVLKFLQASTWLFGLAQKNKNTWIAC